MEQETGQSSGVCRLVVDAAAAAVASEASRRGFLPDLRKARRGFLHFMVCCSESRNGKQVAEKGERSRLALAAMQAPKNARSLLNGPMRLSPRRAPGIIGFQA